MADRTAPHPRTQGRVGADPAIAALRLLLAHAGRHSRGKPYVGPPPRQVAG